MALMPVFDLIAANGTVLEMTSDYAATDDATPISVDDTSASTGDLTVTVDQRGTPAAWKRLKGQNVQVQVTGRAPRPLGKIAHVSGGDAAVSLVVDTVLNRLAVTRHAAPKYASLGAVIRYWAGLCGVDTTDVQVDSAISSTPVAAVGFYDNVWLRIKQFCAALGVEAVSTDNKVVIRPLRPLVLEIDDDLYVSSQWDVDDQNLAHAIQVAYYEPLQVLSGQQTADYSKSTAPANEADDPFTLNNSGGRPINTLPPGWVGYRSTPS